MLVPTSLRFALDRIGRHLAAVGEVTVEHLLRQKVRRDRADPAQLAEQGCLLWRLAVARGLAFPLELLQHLVHQRQPPALARDLGLEADRQRLAVTCAQRLKRSEE